MIRKRQNNIEALRVLCMFLIVVSHYVYHGLKQNTLAHSLGIYPLNIGENISFIDYSFMELLYLVSRVAVDCYVMITGYFLITRFTFRCKGLISVWVQTFFYSVSIALIFGSLGFVASQKRLFFSFLPIYSNAYWFVTIYVGLLLLAPFISKVAQNLSKRNYQILLLIIFIMNFQPLYGSVFSNRIFQFVGLYLVGGYFRMYDIPDFWKGNSKKIYIIVLGVLWLFATLYNWKFNHDGWNLKSSEFNDLILFLALATFVLFLCFKCNSKYWNVITKMAPYTLGVYLIHDNELVRPFLWEKIILTEHNYPMFLHCILSSWVIFILCIAIDWVRKMLFKLLKIDSLLNNVSSMFQNFKICI